MPKKDLEFLENSTPLEESDNETEVEEEKESIQAPKKVDKRKKGQHERTVKQKEAFEKVKAIREEKRKERAELTRKQKEEEKKIIEEKIIKKAISVKKKQIKKQAALDEISDDDTPMEEVKKIMKAKQQLPSRNKPPREPVYVQPPEPPQQRIYFV
jgi:hypothetical protein